MWEREKARGPVAPRGQGLPGSCALGWKCQVRAGFCAAGHCNPPVARALVRRYHPCLANGHSRARRCRIYQIGHAARSYVALHHYIEALDTVFVLAVRSPLEAGVKR